MKGLQAGEGGNKRLEFYLATLAAQKHVLRYSRQAKKTFCNCAKKIRMKAGLLDPLRKSWGLSWAQIASEGGHANFSPANEIEISLLKYLFHSRFVCESLWLRGWEFHS